MLQNLLSENRFDDYYEEVRGKAAQPHLNIDRVIEPLRELVFRYNPEEITVSFRNGSRGNACWVRYNDRTRYFTYHHDDHTIKMRRGSRKGAILASIANGTDLARDVEPHLHP